ncbi:MAG: hypothetical protein JF616_00600 [Fibrobacteres bacterium]|nr:hypothetical protein [Fibrobacterota bacterium]
MTANNGFPATVWRAFERRHRALHLLDAEIESQLVPDVDVHGTDIHRTETMIQLRVDGRSVLVRVHAWPDRWAWIDARHSVRGGWRWQFTTQGRFVNAGGARALVTYVEKMLRTAQRPACEVVDAMQAIWRDSLISGSRRIA